MAKEHRIVVAIMVGLLMLALFFLWGCAGAYPHIKWAEENKIEYSVTYVDKENWESCGFVPELGALYYSPFNGEHWIIIRGDLEKDLKYLDHELCHARGLECD